MPSRYHPIEDGLWDDPKFDATPTKPDAPGEERGFFAFLSSNKMQRPAGIYRATDQELALGYRIPSIRASRYLVDLDERLLIVRDGLWIFTPGYWKRQAHNPGMMTAARRCIESCSSLRILRAFSQRYPLHKEWFGNRLETVEEPISQIAPTEQCRAEQLQSRAILGGERPPSPPTGTPAGSGVLDPDLVTILKDCPHLSLISNADSAVFWDQVLKSCAPYGVDDTGWIGARLRNWNHWFETHKSRRSKTRASLESRLMKWLAKDLDGLALMKAI